MTRYRAPAAASSAYITEQGFAALQQETKDIWKKRAEVTRALSAAAAEGDRSENAEYIYRKKQLRDLDRRIHYLQKRLPALTVVNKVGGTDQVFFGAWVTLEKQLSENQASENQSDAQVEYRIVGGDEIDSDSSKGYISVDSPMAKAMLKKKVNDSVTLKIEGKQQVLYIKKIRY